MGLLTGPIDPVIGQIQTSTKHIANSHCTRYSNDGPVPIQSLTVPPFYYCKDLKHSINSGPQRRRVLSGPSIGGIRVDVDTSSSESETHLNQHTGCQASSHVQVCQFTFYDIPSHSNN